MKKFDIIKTLTDFANIVSKIGKIATAVAAALLAGLAASQIKND